eukprot:3572533-Alexandrium_andersonii.AAC.1
MGLLPPRHPPGPPAETCRKPLQDASPATAPSGWTIRRALLARPRLGRHRTVLNGVSSGVPTGSNGVQSPR